MRCPAPKSFRFPVPQRPRSGQSNLASPFGSRIPDPGSRIPDPDGDRLPKGHVRSQRFAFISKRGSWPSGTCSAVDAQAQCEVEFAHDSRDERVGVGTGGFHAHVEFAHSLPRADLDLVFADLREAAQDLLNGAGIDVDAPDQKHVVCAPKDAAVEPDERAAAGAG